MKKELLGAPPKSAVAAASVWIVWQATGEYENYSDDPRGVFATEELANAHAAQLGDGAKVIADPVLMTVPVRVTHYRKSVAIGTDGEYHTDHGKLQNSEWSSWSNEEVAVEGRIAKWSSDRDPRPDLHVEVSGCDPVAVRAEFRRLVAEARATLVASTPADSGGLREVS